MIPPINMGFYNQPSLNTLLGKIGFGEPRFFHDGKSVSVDFLIRKALRSFGMRKLSYAKWSLPGDFKLNVNTRDILTVVAQKPRTDKQ